MEALWEKVWCNLEYASVVYAGFLGQSKFGLLFSRLAFWALGPMICYAWELATNTYPAAF